MNPAMGGLLSRDPFQGWSRDPRSLNGYCYATNNPVNIVDPNGRVAVSLGNIVGALVVLGVVAEVGLFTYNKALRSRGRSELPRDLANTPEMLAAYGTDGSPRDFDQGVGALIHYWWSQEPRIQETFKIAAAFRNSNYRASQDTRVAVAEHYLYGLGEFFEKQTALWGRVRTGGYSTIKQVSPDLLPPALGYPPSPYAANDSAWYNQAIFGLGTNDVPIECWIVDQKRGLNLNGQVPSQCSWPAKRR